MIDHNLIWRKNTVIFPLSPQGAQELAVEMLSPNLHLGNLEEEKSNLLNFYQFCFSTWIECQETDIDSLPGYVCVRYLSSLCGMCDIHTYLIVFDFGECVYVLWYICCVCLLSLRCWWNGLAFYRAVVLCVYYMMCVHMCVVLYGMCVVCICGRVHVCVCEGSKVIKCTCCYTVVQYNQCATEKLITRSVEHIPHMPLAMHAFLRG